MFEADFAPLQVTERVFQACSGRGGWTASLFSPGAQDRIEGHEMN